LHEAKDDTLHHPTVRWVLPLTTSYDDSSRRCN
jgi:hypothetical protein